MFYAKTCNIFVAKVLIFCKINCVWFGQNMHVQHNEDTKLVSELIVSFHNKKHHQNSYLI